jgi:REP element-mobilizing transposase RayT
MARPLRVEYPDAYYHVINRGNYQQKIYLNDRDKEKFIEYLEKAAERFSIIFHGYCLMSNHYHLLIQTPDSNLSKAMQWINVSYATYFNRKRNRHGHLFQGRFKAILIDADEYLKHLSRYIHLNPVRANMVSSPSDYQWSSYRAFIGKQKAPQFLETDWLLSSFGKNKKQTRQSYKDFVEKVDAKTLEDPGAQISEGFLLGGTNFIKWVKQTFLSGRNDEKEIPQLKKLKPRVALEDVVQAVSEQFETSAEQITAKGRKNNKAREVAIHLSRDICGLSCKQLGLYFGGVSGALITIMHKRITDEASQNRRFCRRIDNIKKQIFNI